MRWGCHIFELWDLRLLLSQLIYVGGLLWSVASLCQNAHNGPWRANSGGCSMVVLALVVSNLWPRFGPLNAFLRRSAPVVLAQTWENAVVCLNLRRVTHGCGWHHAPVGAVARPYARGNLRNGNLARWCS